MTVETATDDAAAVSENAETNAPATEAPPAAEPNAPAPDGTPPATAESDAGDLGLPADYLGADGKPDMAKVAAALTGAQARAEALGAVPESPDKYEIKLPEGLKGLDDKPVEIDLESARTKGFLAEAHKMGLGNAAVSAMLGQYAQSAIEDARAAQDAAKAQVEAERKALGDPAAAEARLKSVFDWASEVAGKDGASALVAEIRTKAAFEAVEKLREASLGGSRRTTDGGTGDGGDKPLSQRLWNKG